MGNKLEKILFIPDCHIPYEDKRAYELMMRVAKDLKPDHLIILGDYADFYGVSSHSKDPNRMLKFDEEVKAVQTRLKEVKALKAKNNVFISGNHENRLERYLMDKAPELYNMVTIPELFKLKELGFKYIPYRSDYKLGKLYVTHDCGNAGRFAHNKALDTYQHNIIIGHCLPWTYKVMTPTGPVPFKDLKQGDPVMSYKDGKVVIASVLEKVKYTYNGEMASFDNNAISMSMTSEHKIYTKDGRYLPVKQALTNLTKQDLVTSANPLDQSDFTISDTWLKMIVAFAADGNLSYAKDGGITPQIRFHLKKERKIERLTQILSELEESIEWTYTKQGTAKTKGLSKNFRTKLLELCPGKILPQFFLKLSTRQRQIVLDELEIWDGSIIKVDGHDYGSRQFCSHKPEEITLVQTLLIQHGLRSNLVSKGTVVTYNIRKDQSFDSRRKLKEFVDWESVQDLEVGCITTEYQNFFVMTDQGNVELSGNTHRLGYSVEGNADGERHLGAMFGWLGDINDVDYMHRVKAARDWALGFGIGYLDKATGYIYVTPLPIVNYSVVVNGKLYKN